MCVTPKSPSTEKPAATSSSIADRRAASFSATGASEARCACSSRAASLAARMCRCAAACSGSDCAAPAAATAPRTAAFICTASPTVRAAAAHRYTDRATSPVL